MKRALVVGVIAMVAALAREPQAHASLTTSELDEVRGYVLAEAHADRVRSLVGRSDLSPDESAAAMTSALAGLSIDPPRLTFLSDVVAGGPTPGAQPVLSVAIIRGLLAHAAALYAQHTADLERASAVRDEIACVYAFIADEVDGSAALDEAAKRAIAHALTEHIAEHGSLLRFETPTSAGVAYLRAQAAIALLDATPDTPIRRVDVATALGLTGGLREELVQRGLLVVDRAGPSSKALRELRALPSASSGVEAIVVGEPSTRLHARHDVLTLPEPPGGAGDDERGGAAAATDGLAAAAIDRAIAKQPALGTRIDRDGGRTSVAGVAAHVAIDAMDAVQDAAMHLIAGEPDHAAHLSDALGALAALAPAADAFNVGSCCTKDQTTRMTHVTRTTDGAAQTFQLEGHGWRIERNAGGAVVRMLRDNAPVTIAMFPHASLVTKQANSWSGGGLVFARLAGAPGAAVVQGPRVRVVGSSVVDAITTAAPGDDVVVDCDLRVTGGPGGLAVRALPTARSFKGVSLLVVPTGDQTAQAVLLVADGAGEELAAAPPVSIPSGNTHVHLVVRGRTLQATLGPGATLSTTLPNGDAHGDVALRAYPGASVEATALRIGKP